MGKSIPLSLCVLFVISVLWKPVYTNDKCSLACKGSPKTPSFLNGHKYNYGVEGTVSVYLTGADKQETSVKILGQVSVTALGNCVNELRVQNLVISGPDGKKYSSPTGLDKPIHFTLEDGHLGPEICTEDGDTRRSINIKRAIISLLQTQNTPSTQVDVFGVCPTEVVANQEGSTLNLHITRDLSRCAHREQGKNDMISAVYNPTAEIKNTQVLQSKLIVDSKTNAGVPEKVTATEEYLYKPFSVGDNGARAAVHTKLTLAGKAAATPTPSQCTNSRTVIFENPHGGEAAGSFEAAMTAVKDTAKNLATEANTKSAGEFAQLVRILRHVNKADLMKIYGQVKGNQLQKKVFLDGLIRAGTGYSIEASIEIAKSKELTIFEQQLLFMSMGNAKHVNNEAIKAAASVLDMPIIAKEVYLGVGALAGAYCRQHNCHSGKNDGITALSGKLAAKLGNCKPKGKMEEDYAVAILKGIRNIRHLEDNLIDKLVACAKDNGVKARVRVAALEAFGADPCSAKLKKAAIELMKNRQLDSEIRIKAYMAVIECPCGGSANEIKTLLETEPVHQVGRYIVSSLRAIRASANPDKHLAKQHYGLIRTPNRFNVDDRKYSFYRELSYNVDALGIGGSAEQSVIYSQDSFLPRSVNLNLTAELFGHNLNIFEVGGRQGNLDRVVEHFLGPKSFLRTEKPQEVYDKLVKKYQEVEKHASDSLKRGRRSVKTEVDNFDKHLKAEATPFDNELDLDMYLKLFGTDAVFLSLGDDKGFDFNSVLEKVLELVNGGVDQLKHFQHEYRAHLLFLDAQLSYPTSTGLPLKLDLIGSATGRLDISTNIDLRQIIRNPNDAKVDVKLVPSTDVEIAGLFLIDADAVATGLKVVTNLHSSTGGHVIAKVIENGQGIDLQLGLPVEKQEILTASNDLVFVTAEKGQKEKHIPLKIDTTRKDYSGCFDQLSGVLGLTLCGEVSVPFSVTGQDAQASISKFLARYPLTGPSKLKVVIEKNDLRGYHIKGIVRTEPSRRGFEVLFDAEGSKDRRTSLSGELIRTPQEDTLKVSFVSPIKTLEGQASFYNKPNEAVILVKANVDKEQYYGKIGFNVQGNEQRAVYKPLLEYQLPGDKGKHELKVDGQLVKEVNGQTRQYTLEGIKISIPSSNEVVDIDGHFKQQGPKVMDLELKAKRGDHNLRLIGNLKDHDVLVEFQNTLNPFVNFRVNGHFENAESQYHNDIDLVYGQDLNSKQNKVNFNQLLKYHKKSAEDFDVITKNRFEIHALPLKIKLDAEIDPKKVDVEVEGQYVDKKAEFDLEARSQIKKPGDYSIKLNAEADKKGVEFFAKRDIVSADKSNLENYIVIKNIAKYELSGVVMHKAKPNDVNLGAIGHLKVSGGGKNEDITFDIGVIENAQQYSSHAKIGGSRGELLDYLLKITRGANANGQLKVVLKDTIAANGQFKVTDADGKGNGAIIVDFKKAQRKIKADVKFVVKEPTYNLDADVFLNFEKDNADKVHFSTNTKRTDKLIDSKNKFEYAGKKTELNVHRDGVMYSNGKTHGTVEVVLPTERCLSLKMDQDINVKDNVINSQANYVLSDATKRGGPASTITFKTKIIDTNLEKEAINVEGMIDIQLKDGKNLQNTFFLKNHDDNGKTKYDFKTDVKGSLIPKPASLQANGDYKVASLSDIEENHRVKGNYGDDISFELTDIAFNKMGVKQDKKYQEDITMHVRLPLEKYNDIRMVSSVLLLLPENQDTQVEYTIIESVQFDADQYKVDGSGKFGLKEGFAKTKVLIPHVDPFVMDVNYKADLEGEKKHATVDIKSQYGKGKTATVTLNAAAQPQQYLLSMTASAPQAEKLKKLDVNVVSKRLSSDSYSARVGATADGKEYSVDFMTVSSKVNPVIDIKFKCPTSAGSRIFIKGEGISANQGKLQLKLENIKDISLDATSEAAIQKDHVNMKFEANSKELGLNNYKVDISSKDAGNGKRLEFHATNDGKNVLSGSTSFISKQEDSKTIIEGSGSVKVKEEQKSANFKYIRTLLTEGNEQGVETFLNLAIGDRSYVAESRVTNLEYKTSYVYCEEKKQCANAELQSKIQIPKPGVFQHIVNIGFDLRKLGVRPEFALQVSNEVSEKKLPQFTLDLHVNKDDKKYYLHMYNQPELGKFPAGITITLPQRVLAMEALVTYPQDKAMPFPIKAEVSMNFDKNKPNLKTAARFLLDVTGAQQSHSALAEFGFTHPALGKEAHIKFRGNLQTPAENSFKIETLAHISFPNEADREGKFYLEASPTYIKLLMQNPIVKVIDLEGKVNMKDNLQEADLKFSLLEGKSVHVRTLAKDFQYYEFTTGYADEIERKLSIIGHIDPEKRVDISADIVLQNQKKNIIHGALYLQDNLVKSDYGLSKDNFKYFLNALQTDLKTLEQRLKDLGDKANKEVKQSLQHLEPTFKQLQQSYKSDLEKLYHEVANDQTLNEFSHTINEIVHQIAKLMDEIVQTTKPMVENVQHLVTETAHKILEMYEKQIEPQVKQIYTNLAAVIKEYFDGLIDVVAHFAALVTDFFEKHKPELEELTNTIAEIFKDLTRLIVAQLKECRGRFADIFGDIIQQIKDLPIIAAIQEKWQELAVPDQVMALIQEAHNFFRALLPTEETRNFADAVHGYVQKKLRQEKTDDRAQLRVIYEKFSVALTSLVQFVRAQLNQYGVPSLVNINAMSLFSAPQQASLPSLGGVPSFSILNRLVRGDFPDPLSLIQAYRPRSLNPLDEVPSKLRAVIVNGQHIFTFDGRHMTFPGSCRYVLAHDFVDRNFTLVMQLQNGAPKALVLEDKSGMTVEIKDNGQVALNGAAHGYPVWEKDVFAFKEGFGRIGLGSTYGAMALCTGKLEVCYIEVNGFYLGKLRGLLGDGNNEPYDDFRMPNGKITNSEAEFGNSYRLASSCAQVQTPDHSHHAHAPMPPACEQVFGASSTLRPLSLVLDMAPFRQACVHAVTADSANALKQACDLARGYTALAVTGLLPAVLPAVCVQCTDDETPRSVGDSYEIKIPNKMADVVVAVETTKVTEKHFKDLVVPLVSQVVDQLKAKHMSDIKVYLVGITNRIPYPIIYDSDIKLKNAKIQFKDSHRWWELPTIKTGHEKVDAYQQTAAQFVSQLRECLGVSNIVSGYHTLASVPLRAAAAKHTIYVSGDVCKGNKALASLYGLLYSGAVSQSPRSHTLVSPTPALKLGGGKAAGQVVGYTEHAVLMLGDKKVSKEAESLRPTLETEPDACSEFVQSSNGIVLSASNYQEMNPGQRKQFLQTASAAIMNKMLGTSYVQECTCSYVDPFTVRSVCINKEKKDNAQKRK